jgi:hypothetical protein
MKSLDLVQKAFQILISNKDLDKEEYLKLLFSKPYVCDQIKFRKQNLNKRKIVSKQKNKSNATKATKTIK